MSNLETRRASVRAASGGAGPPVTAPARRSTDHVRRTARFSVLLAITSALVTVPVSAVAGSGISPGLPVQYGLGDSWAAGQGADPAAGYMALAQQQLRAELDCLPAVAAAARDGCKQLQLINLSRRSTATLPGVTTQLVISEQLPVIVPDLTARNQDDNPRNDVEVVALTVGGNDVNSPILNACLGGFDANCITTINTQLALYGDRLDIILGTLRGAAGPDTVIVITTYDNGLASCGLGTGAAALGAIALEGLPGVVPSGLNDVIRTVAAAHDVRVADVYGLLDSGMWVGDCLHMNGAGHAVVADQVVQAATS